MSNWTKIIADGQWERWAEARDRVEYAIDMEETEVRKILDMVGLPEFDTLEEALDHIKTEMWRLRG